MTAWKENVTRIQNTQPIDEAVTNKPIADLYQRTQYLKEQFDTALVGQALFIRNQKVSSSVLTGMPVFYNSTTAQFEPALAALDLTTDRPYGLAASAMVVGIAHTKYNATLADIVVEGACTDLDLTNSAGASYDDGQYFLSAVTPGKLVKQRPWAGLFVCSVSGSLVTVKPLPREILENHIHYKLDLTLDTAPTSSYEGWLDIDDSIFDDCTKPEGATYGYNISRADDVAAMLPIVDPSAIYLELNGTGVDTSLYTVNSSGLWWLSETAPTDLTPTQTWDTDQLSLWYTRMTAKTDQSCVLSLQVAEGSALEITNTAGDSATTGCLQIALTSTLTESDDDDVAHGAVKTISGATYTTGPVVDGIKGSGGVLAVSDSGLNSDGYARGNITLSLGYSSGGVMASGPTEIVALNNARKEIYDNVLPMLEFPQGRASSITCKVHLPEFSAAHANFIIGMWVLSNLGNSDLPDLTCSVKELLKATATAQQLAFTTTVRDIDNTGVQLASGYYKLFTTTAVEVHSGSTLVFTLGRAVDSYAADLGIINLFYELQAQ